MSTSSPAGSRAWVIGGPVFAMLSLAAVVNFNGGAEGRLRERFAQLEREGKLVLWQPSPYAEELQRDLKQAFALVEEHFETGYSPQAVREFKQGDETPEDLEYVREWVENVRPYVEEMERCIARPPIREALERGDRLSLEMPKLRETWRRLDPVLVTARLVALDEGDHERAIELLQLALDLKQCYDDCTIVGRTISGIFGDVHQAILWILEHTDASPALYVASIGPRLESSYEPALHVAVIQNEIARARDEAARLGRKRRSDRSAYDWDSELHYVGEWLNTFLDDLALAELSAGEFFDRFGETPIPMGDPDPANRIVLRAVIVHRGVHSVVASNALFHVHLALLAHQHRHGEFPERLEDVDGFDDLPVDPHTGSPFPYERLEDGVQLGPARLGHEKEPTHLERR